jgi:LysM repeat protein
MSSTNDNEKTRIVNEGNTSNNSDNDKTQITNDKPTTPLDKGITSAKKKKSEGISKGSFAAGVGAAGVGGVAAGTAFSDEIKDVFSGSEEDLVEAEEVIPEGGMTNAMFDSVPEVEVNPVTMEAEVTNEMHFEFSDSEGFYEVTVNDFDGDGNIDSMSVDAELVDGSQVSFNASGTALDELMQSDGFELADTSDYLEQASAGYFDGFDSESIGANEYHIQSGDTLSEIAEAHGTSVAHIMDMNPSIDDPNIIYAGDDILIPENDVVSSVYEGWRPEWSDGSDNYAEIESESYDYEGDDYTNETENFDTDSYETASVDYESMDWESFEDQPMEDYSTYFNQEDFDSYDSPDAYFASGDLGGFDFY